MGNISEKEKKQLTFFCEKGIIVVTIEKDCEKVGAFSKNRCKESSVRRLKDGVAGKRLPFRFGVAFMSVSTGSRRRGSRVTAKNEGGTFP